MMKLGRRMTAKILEKRSHRSAKDRYLRKVTMCQAPMRNVSPRG